MKALLSCLLFYFLFGVGFCWGQAGVLDSTFGENGITAYPTSNFGYTSLALQNNQKILGEGGFVDSLSNVWFAVVRYNTNGTLDSSFGLNGTSRVFTGAGSDAPSSIAVQPNGKILEAGACKDFSLKWAFALIRIDTNGAIDKSFNGNGVVLTSFNSFGYADYGLAVAVQPDEKIVEVGSGFNDSAVPCFATARFNTDGTLDNSFGSGGEVLTPIENFCSEVTCVSVQPCGKILVGGFTLSCYTGDTGRFVLFRYDTNGVLDNTFGTNGEAITSFGNGGAGEVNEALAMVLQPNGKIVMAGVSGFITDTFSTIALACYNTDGSLDNSFGNGGKVRTQIPNNKNVAVYSVTLQRDGKIIVGASGCNTNNYVGQKPILARYNIDGSLDSSFGSGGFAIIDALGVFSYYTYGLAMQADGKILADGDEAIWRYLSGLNIGILDFSVKQNPILIYPNPIHSEATLQYTLTQTENLNLVLYDMQGRLVQTFFTNQTRNQGEHSETLCFNSNLAAGNYVLRIGNACPNGNSAGRGVGEQGIKIVKE